MSGGLFAKIAWNFRFPLACLLVLAIGFIGFKAYSWKASQLTAERALSSSYKAERDQANKDRAQQTAALGAREERNAKLQDENNRLRRQIKGVLDTPAGRDWSVAPLPAGLAERLRLVEEEAAAPAADPGLSAGADAASGVHRGDEQRPP